MSKSICWRSIYWVYLSLSLCNLIIVKIIIIFYIISSDYRNQFRITKIICLNLFNDFYQGMFNSHIYTLSTLQYKFVPVLKRYNTRICICNKNRLSNHCLCTINFIHCKITIIDIFFYIRQKQFYLIFNLFWWMIWIKKWSLKST